MSSTGVLRLSEKLQTSGGTGKTTKLGTCSVEESYSRYSSAQCKDDYALWRRRDMSAQVWVPKMGDRDYPWAFLSAIGRRRGQANLISGDYYEYLGLLLDTISLEYGFKSWLWTNR